MTVASLPAGEKDLILRIIRNELTTVNYKWYIIAIQLGIPLHKLMEFKGGVDPLTDAIDYWLNENADPTVPIAWKSIVKALMTGSVGEAGLAEKINKRYCLHEDIETKEVSSEVTNLSLSESQDEDEDELDSDIETDLEIRLEQNTDDIMTKYAAYVDCIRAKIQDKKVPPEELCSYLLTLAAFNSSYKGKKLALLSDKKAELEKKDTITGIFTFLITECSSFLNYGIFQKIVKKYNIREDQEELRYHEHLKAYIKQHKVSEFIAINPLLEKYTKDSEKLIFKFDIENVCSLAKVDKLKKSVAKIMKLNSMALQIIDIKEGCIEVTLLIPTSVANAIFTPDTEFTSQQEDEFRTASVMWLEYNGRTFNFEDGKQEEVNTKVKKLKDQLTCSVCLGIYTNPKVLQCHHTYCQKCLTGLVQQDQQGRLTLACPTCHQVTPVPAGGVAGLQSDFRINQLLELKDEDFQEYTKAGPEEVAVASPEASLTSRKNITQYCPEHDDRKIELFCESCSEAICYKCIKKGANHNGHDYEEVDEAIERYEMHEIQSSLETIEKTLTRLNTCREEVFHQREAIEADIHKTEIVDVQKTELIGQLHQLTQVKVKNLAGQKDHIETIQTQLNRHLHTMRQGFQIGNQGEELLRKTTALKQVKEAISTLQPDVLTPIAEADMVFSASADTTPGGETYGKVLTSSSPDPSKCYANIGIAAVGEKFTAVLHLLSYDNRPCKELIDCITSKLVSDKTGDQTRGRIERIGQSQYEISYQPTIKGKHQLDIKVFDQHIKGSPFPVAVMAPVETLGTPILTLTADLPYGVTVNQSGEVLVTESSRNCVSVFSPRGERLRSFGTDGSELGQFQCPEGVAVDGEGNIFVADTFNHRIQKFTAQGEFLSAVGTQGYSGSLLQFDKPCGIAVNQSDGKIYVGSDIHAVTILNSDLSYFSKLGTGLGRGREHFRRPHGIAFDSFENAYVADRDNHRIQVFSAQGKFLMTFGKHGEGSGELNWPQGIALDSRDRVYVSEMGNNRVSIFSSDGQFLTSFGSEGMGPGQFGSLRGLAVDRSDIVYVCDCGNNRVQLFRSFK